MYLRIEQLRVREQAEAELSAFYRDEALPIFARTPGCRFAALLAPWHAAAHLGLTLWASDDAARVFERSALAQLFFGRLLPLLRTTPEELMPVDPDSVATIDPDATFDLIADTLPVTAFRIDDGAPLAALAPEDPSAAPARFVRFTILKLEPLKVAEFKSAFRETIAPEIARQPGCRGLLLAERVGDPSDLRSISLWDREESAARYELSGTPKRLADLAGPLLSPVYEWRLAPDEGLPLGRRELDVESYTPVVARTLPPGEGAAPRTR